MANLDVTGIYTIENSITGKVYVGQAMNVRKRWNVHLHKLRNGRHHNLALQQSFNKYGESAFSIDVWCICEVDREILRREEQRAMDELKAFDKRFGYNMAPAACTNLGVKYSAESRARMSAAQKGRVISSEARRKIALSLTGKRQSDETRQKRREALKGRQFSEAHVEALSRAAKARNDTPLLFAFGMNQTINDWAKQYNINKSTLRNRVVRGGMSMEEALLCGNIKGKRRDIHNQ